MYKLLLFLFVLASLVNAQEKPKPIYIEHNSIIKNSNQIEVFSYRIPYNNLLFTKNGNEYKSSFILTVEFYREDEFVLREIVSPTIRAKNYDETLSKKKYHQDFFDLKIPPGEYQLKGVLSLNSTEVEYKLPNQKILIEELSEKNIFGPIIVKSDKNGATNEFELSNYGNNIPYSPDKYDLIIGIRSSNVDTIHTIIKQLDKTIYSMAISSELNGDISFSSNDGRIILSVKDSSDFNYFIISDFSHLLYEGAFELSIEHDTTSSKYTLNTIWMAKPNILNNPEYSIKLLSYVEDEEIVGKLLSSQQADYYKNLTEYWIENYPSNGMKFNYAMQEYYSRADHSLKNYSSLNAFDGAERDRGRIYILYGPPTSVERNYTEMNEIVEVWYYDNLVKSFLFKDVDGTGKFDLAE